MLARDVLMIAGVLKSGNHPHYRHSPSCNDFGQQIWGTAIVDFFGYPGGRNLPYVPRCQFQPVAGLWGCWSRCLFRLARCRLGDGVCVRDCYTIINRRFTLYRHDQKQSEHSPVLLGSVGLEWGNVQPANGLETGVG